ncbi:MAG: DUF192 domain-containing protein [Chthoniobacterales bacterium]|nr:DUF192 domain-containing protein [Chthoniobacterales bacterium]
MRFLFPFFSLVISSHFLFGSVASATPKQTLSRTSLSIGKYQLDVQLASDEAAREEGLMKRKTLGANEGMLFIFPFPQRVAFWMKDTSLPLSIAYLNSSGRIVEMHDLEPFNEHSVLSSSPSIVYALETPRGWFAQHQVLPGDVIAGLPNFAAAK